MLDWFEVRVRGKLTMGLGEKGLSEGGNRNLVQGQFHPRAATPGMWRREGDLGHPPPSAWAVGCRGAGQLPIRPTRRPSRWRQLPMETQ